MTRRIIIYFSLYVVASVLLLNACKKSDTGTTGNTPYNPTYISLNIPAGWPQPVDIYANNRLTGEGFQL